MPVPVQHVDEPLLTLSNIHSYPPLRPACCLCLCHLFPHLRADLCRSATQRSSLGCLTTLNRTFTGYIAKQIAADDESLLVRNILKHEKVFRSGQPRSCIHYHVTYWRIGLRFSTITSVIAICSDLMTKTFGIKEENNGKTFGCQEFVSGLYGFVNTGVRWSLGSSTRAWVQSSRIRSRFSCAVLLPCTTTVLRLRSSWLYI
ncbi:hypothetical protein T07_2606 [Trichinella nelsoni]|uniref:Uncharacterized protein n=1 Tax=Trichinella nelsoni TaxID=6336 RepID=A0A0V0SH22_9BILA|nr:hypothetical protein T07_2606 [Trichinella nelsoni]